MPSQGQENYVPNPTLDVPNQGEPGVPPGSNPEHWHKGYWLESSWAKYDYKYAGHSGLCVGITILYNGSLNAKWYFDLWPIDDDQVCELTDWYESTVTTQVFVAFGMVNGTIKTVELRPAQPSPFGWSQYYDVVYVPKGARNFTIYHQINRAGRLWTDDYSMTPAPEQVATIWKNKASQAQKMIKKKQAEAHQETIDELQRLARSQSTQIKAYEASQRPKPLTESVTDYISGAFDTLTS